MFDVRLIDANLTYELRHQVLRPHQEFEACCYDTDFQTGAFHIGAFDQEKIISVASFCTDRISDFANKSQYRLRGMATLQDYRKLGAGSSIISYAENLLIKSEVDILWCKGRTSVQKYYEKLGFSIHGDIFDYPPIGPHILMYKYLKHVNINLTID